MQAELERLQKDLDQARVMMRIAYSAGYVDGECNCPPKSITDISIVKQIRKHAYDRCADFIERTGWGRSVTDIATDIRSLDTDS